MIVKSKCFTWLFEIILIADIETDFLNVIKDSRKISLVYFWVHLALILPQRERLIWPFECLTDIIFYEEI